MFGQQQNTGGLWNKPNTPQANTSFGQLGAPTTSNSLFGGAQTTQAPPSMFGGSKPGGSLFGATQPQQQQGSLFGGQTAQTGGSLFGAQQPQQQTGSLFGATSPASFGQPQQQTGSLFGQNQQTGALFSTQTPQQPQQSSLFGAPQPTQQGSLFGQPAQQQGSSLFGQPAQNTGSLFGATQPQQQTGSLFGAQQGSLFGQQQQPQATGGLFGAPNPAGGMFGQPQQQNGSLFGGQTQQTHGGSLFGATSQPQQGGSLFGAPQGGMFGAQTAQAPSPYANNLNMLTSIPLQATLLSNESILDPNYNRQNSNVLSVVLSALVNTGAISQQDADKLIKPTPFDELVKKREKELQKQEKQSDLFGDVPSVFDDPLNFKKFDIPDDYFEMRRSASYWARIKEKEESDKRKFAVVQVPRNRKEAQSATPYREEDDDVAQIQRTKKAT